MAQVSIMNSWPMVKDKYVYQIMLGKENCAEITNTSIVYVYLLYDCKS